MGNLLNREQWTQHEQDEEDEQQKKQQEHQGQHEERGDEGEEDFSDLREIPNTAESKAKLIKRKLSNLVNGGGGGGGENLGEYTRVGSGESTPLQQSNSYKIVIANFDPRSPTSGIVR
jgi:hypothetical protein